jgi:peptidoglycan hydrolase-like protein with peptidoglycan-binding domain
MKLLSKLVATASLSAAPILAYDQALVISNGSYEKTANVGISPHSTQIVDALKQAGYRTTWKKNASHSELTNEISKFSQSALPTDRVVYVFLGHLLHDKTQTFLTPVDLEKPSDLTIESTSVPLNSVLQSLEKHAGAGAVFLAWTKSRSSTFGKTRFGFRGAQGLAGGLGPAEIPQGVLLVDGHAQRIAGAIQNHFFVPQKSTRAASNSVREYVRSQGYLSHHSYLANTDKPAETTTKGLTGFEQSFWEYTKEEHTQAAYNAFLTRYPNGKYSTQARSALNALKAEANLPPEQRIENALQLTNKNKQEIQRALTVLGFDTKGVDGVFGPATRGAISAWQVSYNRRKTGYVNDVQRQQILKQGEIRRQQLLEEAKRKRFQMEQADREFWQVTGKSGAEYDLRVYLKKYPEGLFADQARQQLKIISDAKRRDLGDGAELRAWNKARNANTEQSYQAFLAQFPKGGFAPEARTQLEEIQRQKGRKAEIAKARKTEQSMGLGGGIWMIVERKLAANDFPIGIPDGVVDPDTRRGLRQFQASNNLPATGFMNPKTLSLVFFN